jgi:hypothetical protein
VNTPRTAIDSTPVDQAKISASRGLSAPVTSGRFCVRFMTASMSRSM